jgi:RNase_H superfamily
MIDVIPDQKILLLDIETKPAQAYIWRAYGEQNVSVDQLIDAGGIICVGAKWLGEKKTYLYSDWEHGHVEMLVAIHEMLSHADAVVTYNGDRFDLPKLQGEFLLNGLGPTPPCTSIDVIKSVRKFGFFMNKLAFIGPLLAQGQKVDTGGFTLWTKVMAGDVKAEKKMAKYCVQDVVLLEKLYLRIRPFIKNHPHLGKVGAHQCGACGSTKVHSRGSRRTKAFKIQRLQCQDCSSWQDGTRKKI